MCETMGNIYSRISPIWWHKQKEMVIESETIEPCAEEPCCVMKTKILRKN